MRSMLVFFTLFSAQVFADHGLVVTTLASQYDPGSIIIRTREHALYLIQNSQEAIRYPIAVPKAGKQWPVASAQVTSKQANPAWMPPADVLKDHPNLKDGFAAGDERNPMGVAAIGLSIPEIYIHGTAPEMRKTIGHEVSYGCIRMLNEDVADLYERVGYGTPVYLIR